MARKKILAVASIGGHWIQLLRIAAELEKRYDVIYCSTNDKCASLVAGREFCKTGDFNRKNIWRMIPSFIRQLKLLAYYKPDVLLTTGAAPGLSFLLAARLKGVRTIWIDSVANVEKLSASGRIAKIFSSIVYTQWPMLKDRKVHFAGNVFGEPHKIEK
ncbi:MAG: oligosaccharide biosynthesis protein Alg14 [Muribaculaceae bacterium]|nr:oligosaccharide biosynthesis protein Alg14 [Muribaculaceae bacterium]MDE6332045.1 oligosaccharide biosynthesis protein Alg14 [Muribaculaceae bacterium]